jgi:hypothetical protein
MNQTQSTEKTAYFQSSAKGERIPDWYLNYAEGVPAFAEYFKRELLAFERFEDQSLLNTVALTVATMNNSKDLMHDISQTMFDRDFVYSRDMVMGAIIECLNDYTLRDSNYILGEDENEARVRMTIAILKNMPKSYFLDWNESRTEEHKIRAIIGIVDVISKIV